MKVIVRVLLIVVAAVSVAWLGNFAVTTVATTMPRSGEFRPRHDDHEHHDHAGAGRAGELGASLAFVGGIGGMTIIASRWSRRLRQHKRALH